MAYTTRVPAAGPIKIGEVMNHFGVVAPKKMSKLYRDGGYVPEATVNQKVPKSGTLSGTMLLGSTKNIVKSIETLSDRTAPDVETRTADVAIPIQLEKTWNDQPLTWTYIAEGSTVHTTAPTIDAVTNIITVYSRGIGYKSTVKLKASYPESVIIANSLGDGTGYKTITLTVPEFFWFERIPGALWITSGTQRFLWENGWFEGNLKRGKVVKTVRITGLPSGQIQAYYNDRKTSIHGIVSTHKRLSRL